MKECVICYEVLECNCCNECNSGVCHDCLEKMENNELYSCPICRDEDFIIPVNRMNRLISILEDISFWTLLLTEFVRRNDNGEE